MSAVSASGPALLSLARRAIADSLHLPAPAPADAPILDERRGAFVTLTMRGRLRGCIGRVEPDSALRTLIPSLACSAAFEDPRFPPLRAPEFTDVRLEVSLLTVPVAVSDVASITVGRHGVIVEQGRRRGLLLPQVAAEWNWTREEFLSHACEKAALAPEAWRSGKVTIYCFGADVFSEAA